MVFSHLRWDFVWQRPQHLLSRLAKHYRVIFVEEPVSSTEEREPRLDVHKSGRVTVIRLIYPVEKNHWIGHGDAVTQPVYEELLSVYFATEGITDPMMWLYTPMALSFAQKLGHSLLIYDVMDQLSAFKGAPVELKDRERALLPLADLVFTGGYSLYRDKSPFNPNTHLFPSGVDPDHFASSANRANYVIPAEIDRLNPPILGYFGVIDERMDLDLLDAVAAAHPEWTLLMLGPVVKIDPDDLPQRPNLHYPGMKQYAELPAYLAHFDVALVPFAINAATRYLSPTKTLEYMAAHKPIVSTPIHDVVELYGEVVRIGGSAAEFCAHIESALAETPSERTARRRKEDTLLALHTWDGIATRMMAQIQNRLESRPRATFSLMGKITRTGKTIPAAHGD
jgi:glycosyltransferase involved in cell wall biosynthesis